MKHHLICICFLYHYIYIYMIYVLCLVKNRIRLMAMPVLYKLVAMAGLVVIIVMMLDIAADLLVTW